MNPKSRISKFIWSVKAFNFIGVLLVAVICFVTYSSYIDFKAECHTVIVAIDASNPTGHITAYDKNGYIPLSGYNTFQPDLKLGDSVSKDAKRKPLHVYRKQNGRYRLLRTEQPNGILSALW